MIGFENIPHDPTFGKSFFDAFERNVLRSVYGPIRHNNELRIGYRCELDALYEDINIITFIIVGRLKWAGRVRMDQQPSEKRILNAKPEGRRKMGKPKLRWAG
jgi:hypothetical protein